MVLASGSERFRVPKTSSEETGLVNDTVPPSTKYKNKWAVNIFDEWQSLREDKVPVLDCGGVFKDYDLHKVCAVNADIAAMDVLSLNYWLSKFVMEVAKKIPSKECVWNHLFFETSFGGEKWFGGIKSFGR